MRKLVEILRRNGYRKLTAIALDSRFGDFLVKLASYLQPPGVRSYLRTHVGRVPR